MSAWFVAVLCGTAGAGVGELLELRTSLNHLHIYPWDAEHGKIKKLGLRRYFVLVAVNIALGAAAATAVYGQDPVHALSIHAMLGLGAAGLAAPAVLQKFGGAIRT